jgi:hypothetical protein
MADRVAIKAAAEVPPAVTTLGAAKGVTVEGAKGGGEPEAPQDPEGYYANPGDLRRSDYDVFAEERKRRIGDDNIRSFEQCEAFLTAKITVAL